MSSDARRKIYEYFIQVAEKIEDASIREATLSVLRDPRITFAKVEPKITILESPGAPRKHHAYPGGLIDHTYGVLELSLSIAESYSRVYGIEYDRDLVVAAALLHDIFKYYQYEPDPVAGGFRPRDDWYLSHDFAIVAELSHRGAPDKLIRAVAEVHGTVPFTMIESEIVHHADATDAEFVGKMQEKIWYTCRDIETESNGKYLAIKVFNQLMRQYPLYQLVKVYFEKGKDGLRQFIKEALNLQY